MMGSGMIWGMGVLGVVTIVVLALVVAALVNTSFPVRRPSFCKSRRRDTPRTFLAARHGQGPTEGCQKRRPKAWPAALAASLVRFAARWLELVTGDTSTRSTAFPSAVPAAAQAWTMLGTRIASQK